MSQVTEILDFSQVVGFHYDNIHIVENIHLSSFDYINIDFINFILILILMSKTLTESYLFKLI